MITFNNIVERFQIFADNHFFIKSFSFGSPDDVDLSKFTDFPLMHLVYTGATYDAGTKTYNLEVYILDIPNDKKGKVTPQKEAISDSEQCAEDIIADIRNGGNIFLFAQDYEVVNATTTPLEEETKNVLSGILLDISVAIPYEWDACNAPIDGVEPGGTDVTYARRGILRMLTIDGATDVFSVRTINVTNGTLTDDGDGVVTLDTGGVETLAELTDVNVAGVTDNQVLSYDSATSKWVPADDAQGSVTSVNSQTGAVSLALRNLSDVDLDTTPPTDGQPLIFSSSGSEWIAGDAVNYHDRYQTESEALRAGATATVELYYSAQGDGDGLAQSASTDTPTAGYVINRKIYYSEAGFADPATGTWVEFTPAPADDATFATVKAALLEHLKARTGGTVPISLKQTWVEVAAAPAFTGLLNETYGSGAAAAYSVRWLNGNYTGAAMKIRRASDSTTTNIAFRSDGDIDEAGITTFCTGTTCTILTWYDQSQTGGTGIGNDATQTSGPSQPTIYTGGAIVKENGKVAVSFDGTNDFMEGISKPASTPAETMAAVVSLNSTAGDQRFMGHPTATTSRFMMSGAEFKFLDYELSPTTFTTASISADTSQNLIFADVSDTVKISHVYKNGTSGTNGATLTKSLQILAAAETNIHMGSKRDGAANYLNGYIQEFTRWDSDRATNRASIESNVGDYFTQNTPLLDTYTGAAACYSLRLMRTAYTGSAIRVRRSSDSTELDINFNVFGELDTVSLLAFAGTGDAFVKTWFDQASTNDATQATTANQPQIVSSGAVIVENGKPAVSFDGSGDNFTYTTSASTSTCFVVQSTSDTQGILLSDTSTGSRWHFILEDGSTSQDTSDWRNTGGDYGYKNGQLIATQGTTTRDELHTALADGLQNLTSWTGLTTAIASTYYIGQYTGTSYMYAGKVQELLLYNTDQTTNRASIETNVNTFYSIY